MLLYEQPEPLSKEQAEQIFEQGGPQEISYALLGLAFYEPDWHWVQAHCLDFLKHSDPDVRGNAALCFGHLTRIHKTIDLDLVLPALHALLADPHPTVRGKAQDALSDISIFFGR